MRTVDEIRRARLLELKAQFGSWAAINKALDRTPNDSTLSQVANQSTGSKTDKPKTMGSPQARAIEEALKLERGWMDNDPAASAPPWPFSQVTPERYALLDQATRDNLEAMVIGAILKQESDQARLGELPSPAPSALPKAA
jgi:hypothetical protein